MASISGSMSAKVRGLPSMNTPTMGTPKACTLRTRAFWFANRLKSSKLPTNSVYGTILQLLSLAQASSLALDFVHIGASSLPRSYIRIGFFLSAYGLTRPRLRPTFHLTFRISILDTYQGSLAGKSYRFRRCPQKGWILDIFLPPPDLLLETLRCGQTL